MATNQHNDHFEQDEEGQQDKSNNIHGQNTNNHERQGIDDEKFHKDGYIVIPGLIPVQILHEWQSFVGCCHDNPVRHNNGDDEDENHNNGQNEPILSWLLQELYERGHTPFPEEWRCSSTTSTTKGNDEGANNKGLAETKREYAMGQGVKHGFREIVMRSPGRYEISLLNSAKLLQHETRRTKMPDYHHLYQFLAKNYSQIPSLLSQSSWNKIRTANLSLVISTPGASTQSWHADGGHVNLQHHLPCHCLNVFVALHPVPSMDWGPTQLRPGTHVHTRNLGPMLLAAHCQKTLQSPVAHLLPRAGDALLFDYRLLHRGLANNRFMDTTNTSSSSSSPCNKNGHRSMLVITLAQDWFQDRLNFPHGSLFEPNEKHDKNVGDAQDSRSAR